MHLLAAGSGDILDGVEAVDLGQTPGDIALLSAADTELACLAAARAAQGPDAPSLRLANLLRLGHNLSVDRHVDRVVCRARLVVLRLLGGVGYWRYGVERVHAACRTGSIKLAVLPGDDRADPSLEEFSTLPTETCDRLWRYLAEGGVANAAGFLDYAASLIGCNGDVREPRPLPRSGCHAPGLAEPSVDALLAQFPPGRPVVPVVFYRALVQSGQTGAIDALAAALAEGGLAPLPLFVPSLKDPEAAEFIARTLARHPPAAIVNATGFAVSGPTGPRRSTPFDAADCPVLQVVLAGGSAAAWAAGTRGLSAQDLAMNVALTELDGRILTRAVAFKAEARWDRLTECPIVAHQPEPDRLAFVAAMAAAWARLRATPPAERRVALILANYPNRDGRIGNGVGLDTPAATVAVLQALADADYAVQDRPADGAALMAGLLAGPTNADRAGRTAGVRLPLDAYTRFFAALPGSVRSRITARWGEPEADPAVDGDAFVLGIHLFGHVAVAVQPARGYNVDPSASYHDPALPPPHGYLAFYAWLRSVFGVHAVVHMGKHGNLEWLPGKAVALSADCFPDAVLGPLPHLYPFIVNDPGEGTQAKRRTAAVIVDHLTPPLTRAESYGPLRDLEALVDEYYEAAGLDPRRLDHLRGQIIDRARAIGLDRDCGVMPSDDPDAALARIDNHLCDLKEMQIRDGLHIFGHAPEGRLADDLIVALTRLPRGDGRGGDASLIRALAQDLDFGGFDPLDCVFAEPWPGPRSAALGPETGWRSRGDTVERLEELALALVSGTRSPDPAWRCSSAVLDRIETEIRPAIAASGVGEIAGLLAGLDGRFVEPGPSGAPTRGRLDVLPTGRNFFSVDSRAVPTPAAWHLGWKSASLLLDRHAQEHGEWPRTVAISAWGTANMRTGGDDIAQALALIGVRPRWDEASRRVVGFEILPPGVLGRPRVDVTLRVSGFFRDAFPAQIDLFDSAARAVAALDEPDEENPLAARVRDETAALIAAGVDAAAARRRAGFRVFGSKPGAYGAGLQALIDERGWRTADDLARAYLAWGGWAYGDGAEGMAAQDLFAERLGHVQAVIHNQDNREHDLLDSDDYYQFEGGMAAAVRQRSGAAPSVYHNDHSRPERPVIRTLEEEIARVVRGRVVNPKWIAGAMRHGYKGAFEIAATVDYLFAFAATTGAVRDHHFDAVYDAFLGDSVVRDFLAAANPAALAEIAERLREAQDRALWRPRSNVAYHELGCVAGRAG
jgi:cobaltochelatase CobN